MLKKLCPFWENLNRFPSSLWCIPIFQQNRMKFLRCSCFRCNLRRICCLSQRIAWAFNLRTLSLNSRRLRTHRIIISYFTGLCLKCFSLITFTVDFIQCLLHEIFRLEFQLSQTIFWFSKNLIDKPRKVLRQFFSARTQLSNRSYVFFKVLMQSD